MKTLMIESRRIILMLGVVLLMMLIISVDVAASSVPEYINVGLRFGNTAITSGTISSDEGFILGSVSNDGFTEMLPLPAYTSLIATVEDDHVVLRDMEGVLISSDIGTNGCLMPANYKDEGRIELENKAYRGGIILRASSNDKLTAINYITMDEYLYGVLHMEMSQSYPLEALKAQAVAARCFAAESIGRHYTDGFDVCTTTDCQVYGGCAAEYPRTTQAVDETTGILIWVDGQPAPIFYYKNSGGHTQSISEVWSSSNLSHLKGIEDIYSPDYPWTATLSFDSIEQKLKQAGYDSGTIESVKVGDRNSAGAVSKLIITGSKGTINLEKARIRSVLGTSLVRSTHFNIGETYMGKSYTSFELDMTISNGSKLKKAGESIYVLSGDGTPRPIKSEDLYISNDRKTTKAKLVEKEGSGIDDSIIAKGGSVTFSGLGYGHGVGMAQDGAIEMARQGFNYKEILKYYFTDIEVR